MKVATVTVHSAISYGAMLQAYALRQAIEQLGHDVEILDYRNPMIENKNRTIPVRTEASLMRRVKDIISAPLRYDRNRRFYRFMRQHMKRSPVTYRSMGDMMQLDATYDAFFVGSDQVWNPKHADFDPVYFLQFVGDHTKRHSYAASFGFRAVPEQLRTEYVRRLKDFNGLSVRESSGAAIIKELLDRPAVRSLDPTLLLDAGHWRQLIKHPPFRGGYVLIYEVNQASRQTYDLARRIAKRHGLRVIAITQRVYGWRDLIAHQAGPQELLGYIAGADYVLTDSFHGTVFSILMERPFVFCPHSKADVNVRMLELLELAGLEERAEAERYDESIDWASVGERIARARQESVNYITTQLKEGKDGKG